jgi:hypothetical protein
MTPTQSSALTLAPSADDVVFLNRVKRSRRRESTAGPWGWYWRAVRRLRPRLRNYVRRSATLLLLLAAGAGLAVSTAPPANADWLSGAINKTCDRKPFGPIRADGGLLGESLANDYRDAAAKNQAPSTKWAQYGVQGTEWNTFWLDCWERRWFINEAANSVFILTRIFSAGAIFIFMWTFKGDLLNIFLDKDQNLGGTGATLDDMIARIHADVYLQLFSVAVLIAAVVLLFRFLFQRSGGADVLGKFALMVGVAGVALFYGGVPGGGGPHAAGLLKGFNDWTNEVTSVVLSAFAGTDCETPSLRGSDAGTEAAQSQRRDIALQCAAEALYEVTIYTPWAVGELGTYQRSPRPAGGGARPQSETEVLAARIINQQAYSFGDIQKNGADQAHYRDGRATQDSDICRNGGADATNLSTYTGKLCDRAKMRQDVFGVSDDQLKQEEWSWSRVKPTGNATYWENWSGGQANNRFQIALLSLIGSCSIALIIIIVSLTYLMLELATIMFALMAPVAFLLGLVPGVGMKVLLRWVELILGTFVKRIVLGLFVGLLMALYSVVLTLSMAWLMKLLLVCMIAAIGLTYRKKFSEAFSFNFSGSKAFHQDGQMTGKATAAVGAVVGGAVGSKAAGGGALGGAMIGVGRRVTPNLTDAYFDGANRTSIRSGRTKMYRPRPKSKTPPP